METWVEKHLFQFTCTEAKCTYTFCRNFLIVTKHNSLEFYKILTKSNKHLFVSSKNMLFKMNVRLPTLYLKKFLILSPCAVLYFTLSYLEKTEKTPPFEEIPYACACAVFYIVLPGENREDSSIWRNSLCLRMRCVSHRLTWRKPRRLLHLKNSCQWRCQG